MILPNASTELDKGARPRHDFKIHVEELQNLFAGIWCNKLEEKALKKTSWYGKKINDY